MRRAIGGLAVSLGAVVVPAMAQRSRPCPPATGEPYEVCQVDRAPVADTGNVPPRYPDMLLQAAVGGTARAEIVIDSAGRVRAFRVIESTHDMFAQSAKNAIPRWRFTPATLGGRAVAVRVEQRVRFVAPSTSMDPRAQPPTSAAHDTTDDGVPETVISLAPRVPAESLHYTDDDRRDVQRQAFLHLAPPGQVDARGEPRVAVCLTMLEGGRPMPADTSTLRMLATVGRRAVVPKDCPRTYASESMVYDPKRRRAPPGWIDPTRLVVTAVEPWDRRYVLVEVDVGQGDPNGYRCWLTPRIPRPAPACGLYRKRPIS